MNICIDATSIVNTGGFTHLKGILEFYHQEPKHKNKKIIIVGSREVIEKIPNKFNFHFRSHLFLNSNRFFRLFFQFFILDFFLKKEKIDVLLSVTGDYVGSFRPYVGISQNMLLYEKVFWKEIRGIKERLKLWINFNRQKKCFKSASGIIYISEYAKNYISDVLRLESTPSVVINHGVSEQFFNLNKRINEFDNKSNRIFRFIYVSTVHVYKNQWNVVEAIANLRQEGVLITLTLIGQIIYPPSGKKLFSKIKEKDPNSEFIEYIPNVPHEKLPHYYSLHDAVIFASTCENMPNILIESMASGLPIACSDKQPMPEFLKGGGYYFNANSVDSITQSIRILMNDKSRLKKIKHNLNEVRKLKWEETSKKTFSFISKLIKNHV